MKTIIGHWKELKTGRTGYTEIDATFTAEAENDSYYSKEYKTLKGALNDGKRHFNKTGGECCIYAHWVERDFYDDGTLRKEYDEESGFWGYQGATSFNMYNLDWI